MRMPPLLADFSHARACKPFCEKYLTLPADKPAVVCEADAAQVQVQAVLDRKMKKAGGLACGFWCR